MTRAPYKYLDYYTFEDADIFFGREEETQKMVGEILSTRLLVLFSPSGSGKTSLIHAGVRPALEKLGYRTVYARFDGPDPISSVRDAVAHALALPATETNDDLHGFLARAVSSDQLSVISDQLSVISDQLSVISDQSSVISDQSSETSNQQRSTIHDPQSTINGQPVVIFIDQFEEFFLVFDKQPEARKAFIEQVAKIKYDDQLPVFLVFSLREDYFANLHEFREAIPSIFQNNANLRLEPFTEEEARRAIAEPVKQFGYEYDESLVQTLVADLKNGKAGIEPIALQIVCHTLWQNRHKPVAPSPAATPKIDETIYQKCRGVQAIIDEHVDRLLRQIPQRQQGFMVRIFEALKTRDNTKLYRRGQDLQETLRLRDERRLKAALQKLAEIGVLRHEQRSGDDWYEFKHDYLVPEVTKWIHTRREAINRRRLWYFAAPGAVLFAGLLIYLTLQYNTFYASFTNREYPQQNREIFIARRIDPFNERITTGLFLQDAHDQTAENLLEDKVDISRWDRNNWKRMAHALRLDKAGLFLYQIGETQAGIDSLVAALKDQDGDVRAQAAGALGEIKSSDAGVVDALVAALKDKNRNVRAQAAGALVKLGQSDDRVMDALVVALKDEEGDVRAQAAGALGKLGQSDDRVVGALVAALKDETWNVRAQAAGALGKLGQSDDRVVGALVAALKDETWNVRAQAAGALGKLGQSDDRVVGALVAALKDQYGDVRAQAAGALGEIKVSDDRVVVALVAALKDEQWNVRAQAAGALGEIKVSDDRVVVALVAALKDQKEYVRAQAAGALGEIKSSNDRVVGALVAALKDQKEYVRAQAAGALGEIKSSDDRVVVALVAALKDEERDVRAQAAGALGEIKVSDDRVVGTLVAALKDQNEYVRAQAAGALGEIKVSDDRVVVALVAALKDVEGDVRVQAAGALVKLGQSDDRVVVALVAALKDEQWNVRAQAAGALGEIKVSDDRVVVALVAALKDEFRDVRAQAAGALGKLEKVKPVSELLTQLEDNLSGYRTAAAHALRMKDVPLDSTLQVLAQMKQDDRPWVRLGAWEAYELLEARRAAVVKAAAFLQKADSLFKSDQWAVTSNQFEAAFANNPKITHKDSTEAARAKFQQARCAALLKRKGEASDDLKIALQYNPGLRDTLRAEMSQPENDWKILEDNWYLRDVLLKKE